MAKFGESDDLAGAEFYGADLRGARFAESDLSGVVMRGVEVAGVDIDAPWLVHGDAVPGQRRRRHGVRRGRAQPPLPGPRPAAGRRAPRACGEPGEP